MNSILIAAKVATQAHFGQYRKYSNERPYIVHPARVAARAMLMPGVEEHVVAAAWLHDVAEDCPEYEWALDLFSKEVKDLVLELTNVPKHKQPDLNRAQRKAEQCSRLSGASRWAKLLKLIDRADNVFDLELCPDGFWKLYLEETQLLVDAITSDKEFREEAVTQELLGELNRSMAFILSRKE